MDFPTYYHHPATKLMLRLTSPTHAYLLQVQGRNLDGPFAHRHESVTQPSPERMQEEIKILKLEPSTPEAWQDLMNEFLQVNKAKLEMMNTYRQRAYETGKLRL